MIGEANRMITATATASAAATDSPVAGARPASERMAKQPKQTYELIDCDVHPAIDDYTQLHPFLPEAWKRHVRKSGFGGPVSGFMRGQGGLYRTDVTPPDGGEPGSDPDWLRTQLMERYNVKHPILNGGNILGLGTLPDWDFATAIARAYNDWTIEFWLTKHNVDGRFKSSMFVAPRIRKKQRRRLTA